MGLRPLHRDFLFEFLNEIRDGLFVNKNRGSIIIATPEITDQGIRGRWARVYAVGREVEDFTDGDLVLIEPGKWTLSVTYDDRKLWKSDDAHVLAVANDRVDESIAFDY